MSIKLSYKKNCIWFFGIVETYTLQEKTDIQAEVDGAHTQEVRINLFVV